MEGNSNNPGVTQPTMADKDANFSNKKVTEWSCQAQRKFVAVKSEESELDSVNGSSKRKRTASVTIRTSPPSTDRSPELPPPVGEWRGIAVGQKAKDLLEAIEHHYPNTFLGLPIRKSPIWLETLKQLHLMITKFMETSVEETTEDQVTEFEADLNDYEVFGFDLSWARKRLEMVKRLKFGKEPSLEKEWICLEESLEPLQLRVGWQWKQLMEAHEMWKKARFEYDKAVNARDLKVEEMTQEFGAEFDRVLKSNLGCGMLPGY